MSKPTDIPYWEKRRGGGPITKAVDEINDGQRRDRIKQLRWRLMQWSIVTDDNLAAQLRRQPGGYSKVEELRADLAELISIGGKPINVHARHVEPPRKFRNEVYRADILPCADVGCDGGGNRRVGARGGAW